MYCLKINTCFICMFKRQQKNAYKKDTLFIQCLFKFSRNNAFKITRTYVCY